MFNLRWDFVLGKHCSVTLQEHKKHTLHAIITQYAYTYALSEHIIRENKNTQLEHQMHTLTIHTLTIHTLLAQYPHYAHYVHITHDTNTMHLHIIHTTQTILHYAQVIHTMHTYAHYKHWARTKHLEHYILYTH